MASKRQLAFLLPQAAGVLILGVFALNTYIGSFDVELFKLQPTHQAANFAMAVFDLVAASILIAYGSGKQLWVFLAGIAWPLTFLSFLFLDVETRLCLFTGVNCFSSVSIAFQYLILGQRSQGWALWPYTILSAIVLLILAISLSTAYVLTGRRNVKSQSP